MSTRDLLTVSEAAEVLGLSVVRVRQFCANRRLGQQVGRQWIITADELKQFAKVPRPSGNPTFKKKSSKT